MKRLSWVMAATWIVASSASAQTMQTTISGTDEGVQITPPDRSDRTDESSKVYDKRVGGLVWLEATAGPSRFDVTRFRSLNIIPDAIAAEIPALVVSGPEFGAALKIRAGSVTVGAVFKKADYEPFDLITAGLGFDFLIRAVPFVHPSIKLGINYHTTTGGLALPAIEGIPVDLTQVNNARTDGGGASMGIGLRIPIVRWVSLAADFDYSIIGLAVRGTVAGDSFRGGTAGTAISGTFALTVQLGT